MAADAQRVQQSALISTGFHAAVFGAYILLKLSQPAQNNLIITRVEFLDLRPPAEAPPPPSAAQAPRGLRDFIRMAMPSFKPRSQEPQDVDIPKDRLQEAVLPQAQRLIDRGQLERGPSLRIDAADVRRPASSQLSDIAAKPAAAPSSMASIQAPPASISLDAVGRSAARPSGPAIRIDPGATIKRSGASFGEIAPARSGPRASAGPAAAGAAIDLSESPGPARRPSPAPRLPIGYGRGSGSISLQDGPVSGSGRRALPAEPIPKPKAAEAKVAEVNISNKGMEISGPLAGRKILSAVLPRYPDWARAQGVQAEVTIRFFVSPEGFVLERMMLERTSGYKELDDLSMEALRQMRFVPLAGSQEDQWGSITFRFRLN